MSKLALHLVEFPIFSTFVFCLVSFYSFCLLLFLFFLLGYVFSVIIFFPKNSNWVHLKSKWLFSGKKVLLLLTNKVFLPRDYHSNDVPLEN